MSKNVVQLAADAILQNPIRVSVGGRDYSVSPPTMATLIEVSKYIEALPDVSVSELESESLVSEALSEAWKCEYIGDIIAILMLGKRHLTGKKRCLFGLVNRRVNHLARLSALLLETLSPKELYGLLVEITKTLEIDFFLGILISLKGVQQVRATKAAKMTASGQS